MRACSRGDQDVSSTQPVMAMEQLQRGGQGSQLGSTVALEWPRMSGCDHGFQRTATRRASRGTLSTSVLLPCPSQGRAHTSAARQSALDTPQCMRYLSALSCHKRVIQAVRLTPTLNISRALYIKAPQESQYLVHDSQLSLCSSFDPLLNLTPSLHSRCFRLVASQTVEVTHSNINQTH